MAAVDDLYCHASCDLWVISTGWFAGRYDILLLFFLIQFFF